MRAPLTPARALAVVALCATAGALALVLALSAGSVPIDARGVFDALFEPARVPRETVDIVLALRLPRALCAFAVGGLLALSGALMQVLLRNPLADPYVLGISGGAAVGALLAILAGAAALVGPAAYAGALMSTAIVFALAGRAPVVGLVAPVADRRRRRGRMERADRADAVARTGRASERHAVLAARRPVRRRPTRVPALAALAIAMALAWALARSLNRLARGADHAAALGVNVNRAALVTHALAAFAAAAAVTQAGSVGFVGLVVPHALRLLLGNDQRLLLPASVFAGGALVMVADTLARTVFAPQQVPVGVVTALIGVPTFLWLARRSG